MQDAAPQFRRRSSDTVDRTDDVFHQLIDMPGAAIGEFPFGERPDSFIGVEFRGVGGKMLDSETPVMTEELLEWFPLVGGGVIQENDEGAAQLPQQLTQKHADFFLADVVVEEKVVEAEMVSLGAHGNS